MWVIVSWIPFDTSYTYINGLVSSKQPIKIGNFKLKLSSYFFGGLYYRQSHLGIWTAEQLACQNSKKAMSNEFT
jgi:hypothetical protein